MAWCYFLIGWQINLSWVAFSGFPQSWKVLENTAVMESHGKVLEYEKFPKKSWKVSWMSWKSHGIACSHGCGSFLVCDCHAHCETVITISEIMRERESWKEANRSWNSVFKFCGNPDCGHVHMHARGTNLSWLSRLQLNIIYRPTSKWRQPNPTGWSQSQPNRCDESGCDPSSTCSLSLKCCNKYFQK